MRLMYEGMRFSGSLSELKKYLEHHRHKNFSPQQGKERHKGLGELIEESKSSIAELLEKKDKEDLEYQMTMMQGDNQSFSG